MSKKLNAVIPDETWEELEQIAKGEMRTKSQMAAILLAEAIAARRTQSADRTPSPSPSDEEDEEVPKIKIPPPPTKGKRGKGSG